MVSEFFKSHYGHNVLKIAQQTFCLLKHIYTTDTYSDTSLIVLSNNTVELPDKIKPENQTAFTLVDTQYTSLKKLEEMLFKK